MQPVRLGRVGTDDQWLILDGLKPGDRVVVDGFQKFVAGDQVNPKPWRGEPQSRRPRTPEPKPRSRLRADASAMPSFFIDRPIFAWVVALLDLPRSA